MGMPLDPPLRSRFQARNIEPLALDAAIDGLLRTAPTLPTALVTQLASAAETLRLLEVASAAAPRAGGVTIKLPHFPMDSALPWLCRALSMVPASALPALGSAFPSWLLRRVYPLHFLCGDDAVQAGVVRQTLAKFQLATDTPSNLVLHGWRYSDSHRLLVDYAHPSLATPITLTVWAFPPIPLSTSTDEFVETSSNRLLLGDLLWDHATGRY